MAQEFKSDENGLLEIKDDQFRNFLAKDFVRIDMTGNWTGSDAIRLLTESWNQIILTGQGSTSTTNIIFNSRIWQIQNIIIIWKAVLSTNQKTLCGKSYTYRSIGKPWLIIVEKFWGNINHWKWHWKDHRHGWSHWPVRWLAGPSVTGRDFWKPTRSKCIFKCWTYKEKEEWRGDLVANVFYPKEIDCSKVIIHFQEKFFTWIMEDLTLNRPWTDLEKLVKGWRASLTRSTINHVSKWRLFRCGRKFHSNIEF